MRRPMVTRSRVLSCAPLALLCGTLLAAPGCSKSRGGAGELAHAEPSDDAFTNVPVPPADGPKIFALRAGTAVLEKPAADARKLGELNAGAAIARSKEAYGKSGCEGGWFAVRPKGFVCAGETASIDPAVARALPALPDLTKALPYRYGRARAENVPIYARAPSAAEQLAAEPDLAKVLKREPDRDPLGCGANDVPLDAKGAPTGPAVLLPAGEGIADGKRTAESFFQFAAESLPPGGTGEIKAGALRKGSGVALAGSFLGDSAGGSRRFAVTGDGRVVPVDRLRPILGSAWHGIELDKIGLPVAFIHKLGVHGFSLQRGKAVKHDDELERRTAVPLTGKFRTVEGVRFEESRDGDWLRAQDVVVIVKRHKFPDYAKGAQKWLDVSIANQTVTAYEGTKPVFATLISSGRDQLKDPASSASTARGTFHVLSKHVTRAVDSREVQNGFDVADAPWVMEFEPGFSLTGMYWSDGVGEAGGFHDVGLVPIDARRIWAWADPELPEGWHAVTDAMGGATTMVNVRP
jgi:hypothetical protein